MDEALVAPFQALRRSLERAAPDEFSLVVAVCDRTDRTVEMIEALAESIPELEVVRLGGETIDPLEEVTEHLGSCGTGSVMLTGLEESNPSTEREHPVLWKLNLGRSEWLRRVPRPVVLWVPEYLLALLEREAPDFLDWRSDTLFFDGERQRVEELRSRLASIGASDDKVIEAVRSKWLRELEDLME